MQASYTGERRLRRNGLEEDTSNRAAARWRSDGRPTRAETRAATGGRAAV